MTAIPPRGIHIRPSPSATAALISNIFPSLLVTTCCIATILFLSCHFPSTILSKHLVDIDIGTNGRPMSSNAHKLITFDPSDPPLRSTSLDRYPFVIADFNGQAIFYLNQQEPGCSSLNIRNDHYNQTLRHNQIKSSCPTSSFHNSRLYNCIHSPRIHQLTVQVKKLSSFLNHAKISKINKLKIDAQGSDFAIVKDLFENADHVSVNQLQVECQDYQKSIPLYYASNNCADIITYLKSKRPAMTHKRLQNNCMAAEYNLVFS